MTAGKTPAPSSHQLPQIVAVRPHEPLRSREPLRAGEPPRPSIRVDRPHNRPTPGRHHAVIQQRVPAVSAPARSGLGRYLLVALGLLASALVGAAISMVLWNDKPKGASLDAFLIDRYEATSRNETTVYRIAPPPEQARRQDAQPPAGEEDAQPRGSERAVPHSFAREVKTVKIVAPAQQEVTASIAPPTREAAMPVPVPRGKAPEIKSWRYQLQGVDPEAVAASSADLVVIDYAGSNGPFTNAQVDQMRRKPDGSRRLVLAYMSIGQAETIRWYWPKRSSAWLGAKGSKNYSVKFWHADWQQIIFEYTDKILTAGFDGVYLGNVDEFEDNGRKDDMVEFVARISSRAKSKRADFMVVAQSGDSLIPNAKFRRAIDGFAREDLFYGENKDGTRNSAATIRENIRRLKTLTGEGKPVFIVEYPRNSEQAQTARREISENKFIGLMARRTLDRL
jgi:cysteinyl-tRNA synthetase